ncbi:MAG: monooxygenase [Actinobacteria bacterium QS_8_72_14]|nr:MAG: monooxygenase [Actinobacteria bacterium QS_8_72_14]
MPTSPLVTLHLWRVPLRHVPAALARVATDRAALATTDGLAFARLLGTGDGATFDVRDADVRTWALLAVWRDPPALAAFERCSPVARGWARLAQERFRADLAVLASRGSWGGHDPFRVPSQAGQAHHGASRARRFWAAVPPVATELAGARGLCLRLGIGEAPVGVQGTFSVWASTAALTDFAYHAPAHRDAVRRTHAEGWYAEELFARFALLQTTGTVWGSDPVAGR